MPPANPTAAQCHQPTGPLLPASHLSHPPPTPPSLTRRSSDRRGSRLSDLLEDAPLSGAELGAMLPAVGEEEELVEEEEEEGSEGGSAKRRRSVRPAWVGEKRRKVE